VRTLAVQSQESAVLQPRQVELALGESGDGASLKAFDGPRHDDAGFVGLTSSRLARSQELDEQPAILGDGDSTQAEPNLREKAPPRRLWLP
jgi:hypothetical protein